jgi:DNA-binding IclR family transcriptional regulator
MVEEKGLLQSVSHTLTILEILGQEKEVGVADLARRLNLAKSTVFRVLSTLEAHNFAAQNPETGKYHLGFKALTLARQAQDVPDIRQFVHPILSQLRDLTGETVHLVVRHDDKGLFIDKSESNSAIRMGSHIGWVAPLHCTGTGKALMAYMPPAERDALLSKLTLDPHTPRTICSRAALVEELARIRARGWACDDEEMEQGLYCVAAPVFGDDGQIRAAISVSGPVTRMRNQIDLVNQVRRAGQAASRAIGCPDQYLEPID